MRHLHNGKQYFGIHCTCSPPPKPIFTLQETENEIDRERESIFKSRQCQSNSKKLIHSSCACQFDKCYRIHQLSHTWLSSRVVNIAKRFVSIQISNFFIGVAKNSNVTKLMFTVDTRTKKTPATGKQGKKTKCITKVSKIFRRYKFVALMVNIGFVCRRKVCAARRQFHFIKCMYVCTFVP